MLKEKSNSEARSISIVLDLSSVKRYLDQELDSHDCEDEVAYSVLNLIATAVMTLTNAPWTDQDEIDVAVNYLEGVNGFTRDHAHHVCKTAEAMLSKLVYEHIPDFGADYYYGNTAVTFSNGLACITIHKSAFTVSP